MKRLVARILAWMPVFIILVYLNVPLESSAQDGQQACQLFSDPLVAPKQKRSTSASGIIRSRLVTVNLGHLYEAARKVREKSSPRQELSLNLFEDVNLKARIVRVEETSAGGLACVGRIVGIGNSEIILVVRGNVVSANVVFPDRFYQVRFASAGLHRIEEIDQSAFPSELPPVRAVVNKEHDLVTYDLDSGDFIDVMVVYTEAARSAAGGMAAIESQIDLMIAETNAGYANSGLSQRLRLTHTTEVPYSEAEFNWSTTLDRFRQTSDGYMDEVHTLRDTYGADEMVLIVNNSSSCGIAYVMQGVSTAFASYAFSVISRICATGYYSFAHELGHTMGSTHDRDNADILGAYDYSFGYQAPDEAFRTIMAYNCPGGCPRLNYWSNPDNQYGGQPMGVPYTHPFAADNRRSLNNTAYTVANFRQSAVILTVSKQGTGSGTVTSNPGGIDCGGDCTQEYTLGDVVVLTAIPESGSTFVGWSGGGCGGTGPCTVTMGSSKTITATFEEDVVTLTVNRTGTGSGTVTSNPGGIDCGGDCTQEYMLGDVVVLTAIPESGSTFVGWSGGGCSGTGPCTVTMDGTIAVTVMFNLSIVPSIDEDLDGVPDNEEQGLNQDDVYYDGNADGIPDWQQHNVTSLCTWDSWGSRQYVTVEVPASNRLYAAAHQNSNPPEPWITFPFGLLSLTITGLPTGGSTTATVFVKEPICQTYYKYMMTPDIPSHSWTEFLYDGRTGAQLIGNKIVLYFVDGQRGDSDCMADGTITDPGGPVAFKDSQLMYFPSLSLTQGDGCDVALINASEQYVEGNIDFYGASGTFAGRHDFTVGSREKIVILSNAIPVKAASAVIASNGYLVGYARYVSLAGKRCARKACTYLGQSFSIPYSLTGTQWRTGLELFNPQDDEANIVIIDDSGRSTNIVLEGKAQYSLWTDVMSEMSAPSYVHADKPIAGVEFFDNLSAGGDIAAAVLGELACNELYVPSILHDQQGWTEIGIGSSSRGCTVAAVGPISSGDFDMALLGTITQYHRVSANLSTVLHSQATWARLLGVHYYSLLAPFNSFANPLQGIAVYGDHSLSKVSAVSLNALKFEHGFLGVVSSAVSPTFVVLNPDKEDVELILRAYDVHGAQITTENITIEAEQNVSLTLSQLMDGASVYGDAYIELEASAPLYGFETFSVSGRMEMLPVLQ